MVSHPFFDLAKLPIVDRRLVDPRHHQRTGIESVQTKRGCPLKCDYCTYPGIEGRSYRLRPPSHVADELEHIREVAPDVNHYFIVDSVFNLPPSHARAVCDAIADRGIGLPWTCYVNPIRFDDELAEAMARAGCVGMEIGADSGVDEVLTRLRKGFDTETIRDAQRAARGAGLKDCYTFILGTPGETMDQVRRTLDFVVDLDPFAAILMAWKDDQESLDAELARERDALREGILDMLDAERMQQHRWIIPPLRHQFQARAFERLRKSGLTGPLWQHIDMAERAATDDSELDAVG
jgi:radical SAM superfamily enzyme YgiQ (UPF0313 family)